VQLAVYVPRQEAEEIENIAKERDMSVSRFLRLAARSVMQREQTA